VRLRDDDFDGTDGTPELTWGTNGIVRTNFGLRTGACCASFDMLNSVAAYPAPPPQQNPFFVGDPPVPDEVVAAGFTGSSFAIARYNFSDGSLDTTFGPSTHRGLVIGPAGYAWGATVQWDPAGGTNDRIVLAGSTTAGNDFLVARFNGDGTLDSLFGTGGTFRTDLGTTSANTTDVAKGVVIGIDGSIIAGGYSNSALALVDYLSSDQLQVTAP
jgi:uncharacterized delta-60 repeat protein